MPLGSCQELTDLLNFKNNENYSNYFNRDFKILIVDDQSFNIQALLIILKYRIGLDTSKLCETALSGEIAFKMIKEDI
jgi:ornithine carbamoyltransferase